MAVKPQNSSRQVLARTQALAAFLCAQVLAQVLAAPSWAQALAEAPAQAPAQIPAGAASAAQNIPAPLFWADGITRADELDAYAATGLNTIVVRLFWQPSPDGSLNPDDLEPQRQFALSAAKRGLKIIYSLPAAPAGMDSGFRISASSRAYSEVWTTWISSAMDRLKDTPNLIGWALPDDPRDLPFTDEVGWQRWLRGNFASPAFLNSRWKSAFATFDDATLQAVEAMIGDYRGAPLPYEEGSNQMLAARAQRAAQKGDPSWLFHPASLALAHYKWDAYRALLASWAEVVQSNDNAHPIFSGRLPDYAQLLSLPPSISVSVPDLEPGVAEGDAVTHNPQAIAMARRGGRFKAVPTLLTHGSDAVPGELVPALMPRWIQAAQINGAGGVCFASWADIIGSPALRTAITRTIAAPRGDDWNRVPISTAAVVISPLADGLTLQAGLSLPSRRRGLYGFGEEMVPGEPSYLAFALRWGTAFGSVDFLSVEDLAPDGSTLSHYSTVMLPCALSLSSEQTGALSNYVRGGGVLVADMGAGALEAGSNVAALPAGLAALFGVAPAMVARHTSFNLQLTTPSPLLPTWSNLGHGRGGAQLTHGSNDRGAAFAGLTGYPIALSNKTQMVALGDLWLQQLPPNRNGVAVPRRLPSGLLANTQDGTAFYAPWLLWSAWWPGALGFDAFHGDLLARNAALAAAGAPSLVPQPFGAQAPQWAPVVNYADGLAIFNPSPQLAPPSLEASTQSSALALPGAVLPGRSAPNPYGTQPRARPKPPPEAPSENADGAGEALAPGTLSASVQTAGVGDFLWSDALALFDPSAPFSVVGGRAAPIAEPDEWEERAQAVSLQVLVAPGQAARARLLPIRAQNLSGGTLMAHGTRYDEGGIKVTLWPNANANSVSVRGSEYSILLGEAAPLRLTFYPGRYSIAPRSRHRVTLTLTTPPPPPPTAPPANGRSNRGQSAVTLPTRATTRVLSQVVTADERGRFKIEATGALLTAEVAPAEPQSPQSGS